MHAFWAPVHINLAVLLSCAQKYVSFQMYRAESTRCNSFQNGGFSEWNLLHLTLWCLEFVVASRFLENLWNSVEYKMILNLIFTVLVCHYRQFSNS